MNAETVSADALREGATLAVAVRDASGRVLFPAGTVLDGAAVAALQRHGIGEVSVTGSEAAADATRRRAIETRLGVLFRHAGESEHAERLRRAVLEHRLAQRRD